MEPDRPLVPLLRARDAQLRQTPVSLAGDLRVRRILRQAGMRLAPSRRIRGAPLYVALGAAMALVVQAGDDWIHRGGKTTKVEQVSVSSSLGADCTVRDVEGKSHFFGRCLLQLQTVSIRTDPETEIRRSSTLLEVVRGKAWFEVAPVAKSSPPVRVQVGGGVIEVIGTTFVVEQGPTDGSVHLLEGKIRFTATEGGTTEIRPGERVRWSNAEAVPSAETAPLSSAAPPIPSAQTNPPERQPRSLPGPTPAKPTTAVPQPAPSAMDTTHDEPTPRGSLGRETVERVISLRARGRYQEAMAILSELHQVPFDARTAEVLSFEEGSILEHLDDAVATCRHWKRHLARFPSGQYQDVVQKKVRDLSCR